MKVKAKIKGVVLASIFLGLSGGCGFPDSRDGAAGIPARKGAETMEKATFAAGCFWGVEAAFREVPGVVSTSVGYTGGTLPNPTYKDVCSDRTGHAEAVEVLYDPAQVSCEHLLSVFWSIHDPTQRLRQGPDVGSQYRSAIFTHNEAQKKAAELSRKQLEASGRYKKKIATEIVPATRFWRAEEYHQQYLAKHGQASCARP